MTNHVLIEKGIIITWRLGIGEALADVFVMLGNTIANISRILLWVENM